MPTPTTVHGLRLTRQQLSILLTVIALVLWSHSILWARLEIGFWGLVHSLPISFFLAFVFLTAASAILWVAKENHTKLLCLQLLLMVAFLWLVPPITGGSPPCVNHSYRAIGYIDYIIKQGHFNPVVDDYLSWPGVFLVSSPAIIITSVSRVESLFTLSPLLMQLGCLIPLYAFLKNTLGAERLNYCWAGCWLFCLARWTPQAYFSCTQGAALLLLLTLLALITSPSLSEKVPERRVSLSLMVLVFCTLVVTHLLTSIVALCIVVGLCLVKRSRMLAAVAAVCLLLLIGWSLTGASGYVVPTAASSGIRGLILGPEGVSTAQITSRLTGSQSHIAVARMRVLFSAIFVALGLLGAIWVLLIKRDLRVSVPVLAIAVAPLVLVPLRPFTYSGELLQRLYLLSLAPMAYFGARLLEAAKRPLSVITCLVLVIALPLHIVSYYGNQLLDYYSPAQAAGVDFFKDKTDRGYVTEAFPTGGMQPPERYYGLPWGQESHRPMPDRPDNELPHYVGISRQARGYYEFIEIVPEFVSRTRKMLSDSGYSLVYDCRDLELHMGSAEPEK